MSPSPDLLPDALLVERMAALSDRTALLELDARHGMTLYALAYGLLFDGEAADVAEAAALREAWRSAASFDANGGTVAEWLGFLTRRAAVAGLGTRDWGLGTREGNPESRVPNLESRSYGFAFWKQCRFSESDPFAILM